MKKKYYVYMHLYNSQPVYIGKGSVSYDRSKSKGGADRRAYEIRKRNERYTNFIEEVGKENIEVQIVARFDEEDVALWLEDELHEVYDSLYSLSNRQVAKLISERNKGKEGIKKAIVQLTMDGEFVKEYAGATDAVGFLSSGISICCTKDAISHRGYRWMFADEYYSGDYSFKQDNRGKDKGTSIVVVSKDNVYCFNSHKQCYDTLGFYSKDILKSSNNYSKRYDLFVMKQDEYNNETYDELIVKYKIGLVQLDKYYNLIKHYARLNDVDDCYNIAKISDCINKRRKHHRNYLWFTLEEYLEMECGNLVA